MAEKSNQICALRRREIDARQRYRLHAEALHGGVETAVHYQLTALAPGVDFTGYIFVCHNTPCKADSMNVCLVVT